MSQFYRYCWVILLRVILFNIEFIEAMSHQSDLFKSWIGLRAAMDGEGVLDYGVLGCPGYVMWAGQMGREDTR